MCIILCTKAALGVLCCFALFVCLTLLASFFLPSHLSFKNMYLHVYCMCIPLTRGILLATVCSKQWNCLLRTPCINPAPSREARGCLPRKKSSSTDCCTLHGEKMLITEDRIHAHVDKVTALGVLCCFALLFV